MLSSLISNGAAQIFNLYHTLGMFVPVIFDDEHHVVFVSIVCFDVVILYDLTIDNELSFIHQVSDVSNIAAVRKPHSRASPRFPSTVVVWDLDKLVFLSRTLMLLA